MKTAQQWLSTYAETHQNRLNKTLHLVCVPVIMFSVLGILWELSLIACGLLIVGALGFYFRLGKKPFLIMFSTLLPMVTAFWLLEDTTLPRLKIYLGLFVVGWIGQFIGHQIEGKKPSFFQDLQFLFIGPLWIFSRRGK